MVTISNEGSVVTTISLNGLKTKCKMDIHKFPFDTQICPINIGSWSQDNGKLNITYTEIKTDDYINNPTWMLKGASVETFLTKKRLPSFINDSFIDEVEYNFTLTRRPLYFMINGIFPCLILNCLTILFFFLPYASQITLSNYFYY